LLTLLLIITHSVEQHMLLWTAYGVFSSVGTLTYSLTSCGFPLALSGRATTLLNLLVFLGAFGLQWGMGLLIDLLVLSGHSPVLAHQLAFSGLFVVQAVAYLWLLISKPAPPSV